MKTLLKNQSFKAFMALDRVGVHVLPKHFYTPIADHDWLRNNRAAWIDRASLTGVHWDLDQQLAWLREIATPYYGEVAGLGFFESLARYGSGFGPIESQVLHCAVRSLAPPRIVEIGSGASTACMLHAIELNKADGKPESQVTCIEPFPKPQFRNVGNVDHIQELCQTVPSAVFAELRDGDLLFIDSSHAVKTGSDVIRIYLDIVPKLPPGVHIHIHDIYLPYVYPRRALLDYFGWQETSLVLALLTGNAHLAVQCCLAALHYDRTEELQALLTDYRPQRNDAGLMIEGDDALHFPSSLWLRTC
jgi:hypothetical protein